MFRTPGAGAEAGRGGVSVHVAGAAARFDVSKRFAWSFRRFITYEACEVPNDASVDPAVVLEADESLTLDIAIRVSALFKDGDDQNSASGPARGLERIVSRYVHRRLSPLYGAIALDALASRQRGARSFGSAVDTTNDCARPRQRWAERR